MSAVTEPVHAEAVAERPPWGAPQLSTTDTTPSFLLPPVLRVTHPVLSSWCCHNKVLQAGWLAAAAIYVRAVPEKSGKVSPAFLALNLLEGTFSGLTHPVSMVPHVCGLVAILPQALPPSSLAPALLCESFFHSSREDMSVGIGPIRRCKVFQGEIALTDSECWDNGDKVFRVYTHPAIVLSGPIAQAWNLSSEKLHRCLLAFRFFILISNILIFSIL